MAEPAPGIDFANLPAPNEGILVALFITVRKVARSRDFYSRVLGGTVVMDENPCIVKLSNSWIIMNPGGPPTPDKPDISVVDYQPGNTTSMFMNLRVADIQACYEEWKSKGAEFVTPPIDRGRVEELFGEASKNRSKSFELKRELDRLGLFKEYEDRFLDLFKKVE